MRETKKKNQLYCHYTEYSETVYGYPPIQKIFNINKIEQIYI